MGTRLYSEYLIKKHCPHVKYVRVHTSGKHTAMIYAWNEDLKLSEEETADLEHFASLYLLQHVCFHVKAYPALRADRVPMIEDLPDRIVEAAMQRDLDQYKILRVINSLFTNADASFQFYDVKTGTIHFEIKSEDPITAIEKELVRKYLYEIIPLGSYVEVHYV
ncbi:hypothetical protein [Paenibacillus gansuensis]|uniref:Uncharacterized protein n=1 Tax=Paenibacillus gansuensis TaxID=306542 RepID=A0ABW5P9M9_9BACL